MRSRSAAFRRRRAPSPPAPLHGELAPCHGAGPKGPWTLARRRTPARRHDARKPGAARRRPSPSTARQASSRRDRPLASPMAGPPSCWPASGPCRLTACSRWRASPDGPAPASTRAAWASARCRPCRSCWRNSSVTLDHFDLVELNEAFAPQVLAVLARPADSGEQAQRARRRHRARSSHRLHRHAHRRHAGACAEAARAHARPGDACA